MHTGFRRETLCETGLFPGAMVPEPREGAIARRAKRIMRKPRTLHCPFCEGKVVFTRNEEHLDEKNCPHCGMRVVRREWPEERPETPGPS